MISKETPLQGIHVGTAAKVTITELPPSPMLDLRVAPASKSYTAITTALNLALPLKIGETTSTLLPGTAGVHALCLAPDWWLVLGLKDADQQLQPLRENNDRHFSLVDVSGQRTTIELKGPNARAVLSHLWEQDLRERRFPVGAVSQGLMAKAPVIVWHFAPQCYRVMVRSSFAVHLWEALSDAALEWM